MADNLILLVGLGNPGNEYEDTRHNAGFMAVDAFIRRHKFCDHRSKYKSEVTEGSVKAHKVMVMKPQTFMNNSGIAVSEAVRFYKIPLQNVIVLYDELDLPVGKVKTKTGGGDGGHNGIKSLDAHIGKDYRRIRIGIGHPGDRDKVLGYVLGRFRKEERELLDTTLDQVAATLPELFTGADSHFSTRLALLQKPKKPKLPKPEVRQADGAQV